jgi:ABC-type Fe3+ transport system permease subunit
LNIFGGSAFTSFGISILSLLLACFVCICITYVLYFVERKLFGRWFNMVGKIHSH